MTTELPEPKPRCLACGMSLGLYIQMATNSIGLAKPLYYCLTPLCPRLGFISVIFGEKKTDDSKKELTPKEQNDSAYEICGDLNTIIFNATMREDDKKEALHLLERVFEILSPRVQKKTAVTEKESAP